MKFEQIAEFALGPTPIPSSALNMAALLLIDTLGVAAGAAQMQAGRIAREHAFQFHAALDAEHGEAHVRRGSTIHFSTSPGCILPRSAPSAVMNE